MKEKLIATLLLTAMASACQTEQKRESEPTPSTSVSAQSAPNAAATVPAAAAGTRELNVAGLATCQPTSEVDTMAARALQLADADGNGQVTRDEAQALANLLLGGAFFRADQNADGKITPEEGRAVRKELVSQHSTIASLLARARNSTGATPFKSLAQLLDVEYGQTLTLSEARAAAETAVNDLYALTDTNKDGVISRAEALQAGNAGAEAIGQQVFAAADDNQDHSLSSSEFETAVARSAKPMFDMFDTNKDGKLTEAEASAAINAAGLYLGMPKVPG